MSVNLIYVADAEGGEYHVTTSHKVGDSASRCPWAALMVASAIAESFGDIINLDPEAARRMAQLAITCID